MISSLPSARWRPSPVVYGLGRGWKILLVTAAALLLFTLSDLGYGIWLALACAGATLIFAVWRWPYVGLAALVVLDPLHQFVMLLLLHFSHSTTLVKGAQLWKEAVVIALLAMVVHFAFQRRAAPRVHLLDLLVVVYLAYMGFYIIFPSVLDGITTTIKVYGFRADAFFLLPYFIGRGFPLRPGHIRKLLLLATAVTVVIGLVAIVQFAAPNRTVALFNSLGLGDYLGTQGGDGAVTSAVRRDNFGGLAIPRASSLLLSDIGLAFYTLLGVPLVAAVCLTAPTDGEEILAAPLLLASLAATVLSITRSAIIAMVPVLGAMALRSRRILTLLGIAIPVAFALFFVAQYLHLTPAVLAVMISPQQGSLPAHIQAILESVSVLQVDPFGRGLGTAGTVAQRFALAGGLTNESRYLQVATEIGVPGALIWTFLLAVFGITAFRQYGRVEDRWVRALCLGMGGSVIGFAIVSLVLHAWWSLTTSIEFWLLAGMVVSARTIETEQDA
ncbi:MAG TPA: hypothetical protein VGP33_12045 [Chloroflexota bacterium]|nr:hypothetical protein [Chloroflexota bacterium]